LQFWADVSLSGLSAERVAFALWRIYSESLIDVCCSSLIERRGLKMLILNERNTSGRDVFDSDAFTRKQLANARSGQISLTDLEQSNLSDREVAKFLMRQIPIMRAAAFGGKFDALGTLLEEIHRALSSKVRPDNDRSVGLP
jgi:hypothetical protein